MSPACALWAAPAAPAETLAAPGTRATMTVEYEFVSSGERQDKVDSHAWQVRRFASVTATMEAQRPQTGSYDPVLANASVTHAVNMDTPSAETAIARSHGRIQWLALSSILSVIVGVWLLRDLSSPAAPEAAANTASHVAGWLSIVFGGLCAFWAIRRLRDRRPGLVIGPEGLTDRSNVTSAGFVPWADIERIEAMVVNRQPMLLVHVHDPAPYLARGSALAQTLRKANWRACGTPIVIAAHALQMRGDLLQAEIQDRLDRHRAARGPAAADAPSAD